MMTKVPKGWGMGVVVAALGLAVIGAVYLGSRESASDAPSQTASATPSPLVPVCDNHGPSVIDMREARTKPYPMSIDVDSTYLAEISTSCGTMLVKLFPGNAPSTVNNFVNLARDDFFRGMVFHRIDRSLGIIQSGDPACPVSEKCGLGGPGYTIPDEFRNGLEAHLGSVFMASAGTPNSSGSQFEIIAEDAGVTVPVQRTVFGQLVGRHSRDIARIILSVPTRRAPNAPESAPEDYSDGEYVYINDIKITQNR